MGGGFVSTWDNLRSWFLLGLRRESEFFLLPPEPISVRQGLHSINFQVADLLISLIWLKDCSYFVWHSTDLKLLQRRKHWPYCICAGAVSICLQIMVLLVNELCYSHNLLWFDSNVFCLRITKQPTRHGLIIIYYIQLGLALINSLDQVKG